MHCWGSSLMFRSNGVDTEFAFSSPYFSSIASIYFVWLIVRVPLSLSQVISILTSLLGSPRSVISNWFANSPFRASMRSLLFVNSRRSSTHMVMISILLVFRMYMHGSLCSRSKPIFVNLVLSLWFYSRPDCFSPYMVLIKRHRRDMLSLNPSSWFMYISSFRSPFRYTPLSSICWISQLFSTAKASIALIISSLTTGQMFDCSPFQGFERILWQLV